MKILSVDDSRAVRLFIRKHLAPLGLEIIEASDGKQGVARAFAEAPDLILLDVNMPIMQGLEVLGRLKETPETRDIPVIMLTAESTQERVVELTRLGISDYLVKPFSEHMLQSKVMQVLGMGQTSARDLPGSDAEPRPCQAAFMPKPPAG